MSKIDESVANDFNKPPLIKGSSEGSVGVLEPQVKGRFKVKTIASEDTYDTNSLSKMTPIIEDTIKSRSSSEDVDGQKVDPNIILQKKSRFTVKTSDEAAASEQRNTELKRETGATPINVSESEGKLDSTNNATANGEVKKSRFIVKSPHDTRASPDLRATKGANENNSIVSSVGDESNMHSSNKGSTEESKDTSTNNKQSQPPSNSEDSTNNSNGVADKKKSRFIIRSSQSDTAEGAAPSTAASTPVNGSNVSTNTTANTTTEASAASAAHRVSKSEVSASNVPLPSAGQTGSHHAPSISVDAAIPQNSNTTSASSGPPTGNAKKSRFVVKDISKDGDEVSTPNIRGDSSLASRRASIGASLTTPKLITKTFSRDEINDDTSSFEKLSNLQAVLEANLQALNAVQKEISKNMQNIQAPNASPMLMSTMSVDSIDLMKQRSINAPSNINVSQDINTVTNQKPFGHQTAATSQAIDQHNGINIHNVPGHSQSQFLNDQTHYPLENKAVTLLNHLYKEIETISQREKALEAENQRLRERCSYLEEQLSAESRQHLSTQEKLDKAISRLKMQHTQQDISPPSHNHSTSQMPILHQGPTTSLPQQHPGQTQHQAQQQHAPGRNFISGNTLAGASPATGGTPFVSYHQMSQQQPLPQQPMPTTLSTQGVPIGQSMPSWLNPPAATNIPPNVTNSIQHINTSKDPVFGNMVSHHPPTAGTNIAIDELDSIAARSGMWNNGLNQTSTAHHAQSSIGVNSTNSSNINSNILPQSHNTTQSHNPLLASGLQSNNHFG